MYSQDPGLPCAIIYTARWKPGESKNLFFYDFDKVVLIINFSSTKAS